MTPGQTGSPKQKDKRPAGRAARPPQGPDWAVALERHGLTWAAGSLALLLVLFFFPIVFGAKTFESPDHVAYESHLPFIKAAFASPGSFFQRFPLWNPYVFSGMPSYASLLAAPQTNPLSLLFGFLPEIFRILLFYFFLGLSAWLLFRRLNLGVLPALLGATVCVFSTQTITMIMFGQHVKLTTFVFTPLFLLLTDEIWRRPGLRPALLLALVTGTMLLCGHFQIAFYALSAGALYLLTGLFHRKRDGLSPADAGRRWGLWLAALAAGLAAAAALILPVREYSASSIRGTAGAGWDYATSFSLHPLELVTLLVPSFYGYSHSTYWGWMPFTDFPFYCGILPLFLAVLTLVAWPRERWSVYGLVLVAFALLLSFGKFLPLLYRPLFALLPFFNKFRVPSMAMVLASLGLAALAAFGLERLQAGAPPRDAERLRRSFRLTAGVFAGLLVLFGLLALAGTFRGTARERRLEMARARIEADQLGAPAPITPAMQAEAAQAADDAGRKAGLDALLTLAIFAAGAALIGGRLNGSLRGGTMAAGLLLLCVVDLFRVDAPAAVYRPRLDPPAAFQDSPAAPGARFLKSQPGVFRILPFTPEGVGSNWYAYYGLQSLLGYHPAKVGVYQDLIDDDGPVGIRKLLSKDNYNLINLLGARYLISEQPINTGPFRTIQQAPYFIAENPQALPRLWFVDRARVIEDPARHLQAIADPAWNPREEALLFTGINRIDPGRLGTAAITRYEPREIRARLDSPGSCLLLVSEIYYQPGWTATLDGRPTEIYRADYALRAVRVPPGTHELVMRFDSAAFRAGVWITVAAYLLLGAALLAVSLPRRQRPVPGDATRA